MHSDEVVEVVDLCDSDVEQGLTAPTPALESSGTNPYVRIGTMTVSMLVMENDVERLSPTLQIKRDALATEFQLAVFSSHGNDLPVGYIPSDTAQLLERAVIGDYLHMSAEISRNAFKRIRLETGDPLSRSVPLTIIIAVRPAFITSVYRLLQYAKSSAFICDPAIFAIIQAQRSQTTASVRAPSSNVSFSASSASVNQNIIWKLFDNALSAVPVNCKAAEPDPFIITPVYDYQKSGLGWMIAHEQIEANNEFQQVFWSKLTKADGAVVFHNFFTGESSPALPKGFRGGILADEMGLGKTLQVIALIVSNSRSPECSGSVCNMGPTLIVCPVSVIGNWVDQFRRHVDETSEIRVLVYHGNDRFNKQLDQADVVITTYATLSADYKPIKSNPDQKVKSPIFSSRWLRVVLDEAHIIRSQRSLQHAAVIAIDADRRWCLSGTPIQNHLDDFYSLLKFLRAEPLDDYRTWNGAVVTPFKSGSSQGTDRVQSIFRAVCLRRTKESEAKSVFLPPKTVFFVKVELSETERRLYNVLVHRGRARFSEMIKSGKLLNGYAGVLEMLLRMRMCCNHPNLVPSHFFDESLPNFSQTQRTPVEILSDILQESNDEDCCFCLQPLSNPCITRCAHLFCRQCIVTFVSTHHSCPVCSFHLDEHAILRPEVKDDRKVTQQDIPAPYLNPSFVSSKIRALLDQLKTFRNENPSIKSVLFSQWVGMLSIVETFLMKEGFVVKKLTGSMSRQQREAAINSFQKDPNVTIFMISLQVGNVGLTLTAASRVFILDLWYNPGLEQQAIDRVHRVGQTQPVFIYRFLTVDTVEEKILQLQEKKKDIMKQTLASGKIEADKPKTVLEEINYLFS